MALRCLAVNANKPPTDEACPKGLVAFGLLGAVVPIAGWYRFTRDGQPITLCAGRAAEQPLKEALAYYLPWQKWPGTSVPGVAR